MSILENNCMQSTASAAGYSTGSMIGAAIPALLLLSVDAQHPRGQHLPWYVLTGWTFCTAMMGVVMAIPMKRTMINHERLKFPSGLAAATTLQSLYSHGTEAIGKARALMYAALVAGLSPILMDLELWGGRPLLPSESPIFDWLRARGLSPKTGAPLLPSDWGMVLDHKLVMVAMGIIIGPRVCASMLLGALALTCVIGPAGLNAGAVTEPAQAWREIGIWVGAPMMVSAGLFSFALQWRTIGRAFRGFRPGADPHRSTEVPTSWFLMGTALAGTALVWMARATFEIPVVLGALAVVLSFGLSLVACRATGETDITPVGQLAQVTQLTYGVLMPQNAAANLMTGCVTAATAGSAADLLTDLKSGYLLGASARRQFVAQALGVFVGTAASVLCFRLLVRDATALTGVGTTAPVFPAPAAQAWLAVARVFQQGIGSLHPAARVGMLWGAIAGTGLTLLDSFAPRIKRWLPSATGIGLGLILPFQYPLSFFIGAVIAWVWQRRNAASAERYAITIASGAIAGESIVGVAAAAINTFVLR
jgi:uncharacterized oligopeptide transporter (OPT) family protein